MQSVCTHVVLFLADLSACSVAADCSGDALISFERKQKVAGASLAGVVVVMFVVLLSLSLSSSLCSLSRRHLRLHYPRLASPYFFLVKAFTALTSLSNSRMFM